VKLFNRTWYNRIENRVSDPIEGRWRRLNGHHLVALVRAGAKFVNGELVEGSKEKVAA
jgi:hypothetical protein